MSKGVRILVHSSWGDLAPQIFATTSRVLYPELDDEMRLLQEGPDHEDYWEAWDHVQDHAKHDDSDGRTWLIHHDGDVLGYCLELMTFAEKEQFGYDVKDELAKFINPLWGMNVESYEESLGVKRWKWSHWSGRSKRGFRTWLRAAIDCVDTCHLDVQPA